MKDTHIIWSNHNLNFDDWKSDLQDQYPDKTQDELIELMHEINSDYLDDERINLDIQLSRNIVVIADIGRWNGRFSGYKEIASRNIRDCLYTECDYATWYVDRLGDLRCDAYHHDGVNHYLYRTYKDNASDTQIANLKDKIYNGTITRSDITRVTDRLGDEIAKVYGFDIRKVRDRQGYER